MSNFRKKDHPWIEHEMLRSRKIFRLSPIQSVLHVTTLKVRTSCWKAMKTLFIVLYINCGKTTHRKPSTCQRVTVTSKPPNRWHPTIYTPIKRNTSLNKKMIGLPMQNNNKTKCHHMWSYLETKAERIQSLRIILWMQSMGFQFLIKRGSNSITVGVRFEKKKKSGKPHGSSRQYDCIMYWLWFPKLKHF